MIQKLIIGWLYPQLMNTYGDRGNIIVLTKRCEWRDIAVEVQYLNEGFAVKDLTSCDLLFMGGAQDKQQQIVSEDLNKEKVKALYKTFKGLGIKAEAFHSDLGQKEREDILLAFKNKQSNLELII